MIRKFQKNNGTMVNFGNGTIRIKNHILQSRYGAQVEFTTCEQTELGKEPKKVSLNNKVVFDFANVESLDVLIQKLTDLREDLSGQENVELPQELRKLAIEYVKEKTGIQRAHKSQAPLIEAFEMCYKIMVEQGLVKDVK